MAEPTSPSRGDSPSAYLPGFEGTSGVKMRLNELKAQVISGTIISGEVTYAKNHQLGAVPKGIFVTPILTEANVDVTISGATVGEANASAATSAKFYVIGNVDGLKYRAFLLL